MQRVGRGRRRRGERRRRQERRASATISCAASRSRGTRLGPPRRSAATAAGPSSRSASSRGATAGSSRRSDHANLGVGGWANRGAPTPRPARLGLPPRTACRSPRLSEVKGHRLPMRRPGAARLRRPHSARRRRRRPRRPALGRRDLRGVRLRTARGGRDPHRRPRLATVALWRLRSTRICTPPGWRSAPSTGTRLPASGPRASRACSTSSPALLRGELRHPSDAGGVARPPLLRVVARLATLRLKPRPLPADGGEAWILTPSCSASSPPVRATST